MAIGHVVAGAVDPATNPDNGVRLAELLLNWVIPVALVILAIKQTHRIADHARLEARAHAGTVLEAAPADTATT